MVHAHMVLIFNFNLSETMTHLLLQYSSHTLMIRTKLEYAEVIWSSHKKKRVENFF